MEVRALMQCDVITLHPEQTLKAAAARLAEHDVSGAPVVDDAGRLLGILTDADVVAATLPDPLLHARPTGEGGRSRTVGEAMTRDVAACAPHTDAADAVHVMVTRRYRLLPVVEHERLVGIVSRRDVLRLVARSDQQVRTDLLDRLRADAETIGDWSVEVHDGAAVLRGPRDPVARTVASVVARRVPGVLGVRFE